jgi:hypothetical protein
MIASSGDADVVTSGFSAGNSCPQRLHVKQHGHIEYNVRTTKPIN